MEGIKRGGEVASGGRVRRRQETIESEWFLRAPRYAGVDLLALFSSFTSSLPSHPIKMQNARSRLVLDYLHLQYSSSPAKSPSMRGRGIA